MLHDAIKSLKRAVCCSCGGDHVQRLCLLAPNPPALDLGELKAAATQDASRPSSPSHTPSPSCYPHIPQPSPSLHSITVSALLHSTPPQAGQSTHYALTAPTLARSHTPVPLNHC
ncbi:hypothetical protein E2C01_023944 [Portunus trituberculatus]|uniref:Uncharacterized protein n=1 Tax=Portunus trituberculatus TaxID=210409 RepID=A0A5B7EBV9_PORTR|nr:hypothetical protein [Portunus trituberculatus]